jgi:metal-responsive CopG/Arc/MetJ family transcriptional regulator
MFAAIFRTYFIGVRITRQLNERLNKFCGGSQIARSKVLRLALQDFLNGSNDNRKELDRSVKKYGYAAIPEHD